jgi:hypothetical protein
MGKLVIAAALVGALVPAFASAADGGGPRIARAFARLGMPAKQSRCYGHVISAKLGPAQSDKAARIVETARNADDVRHGVEHGGAQIMIAFATARARCGT